MINFLLRASALAIASTSAAPLLAQTAATPAADDENGIREIVVTAQKRSESAQRVPIAISAFDSQALAERNVTEVAQLSNVAPNVTLDASTPFSGSTSILSAYIRGIGANDFAINLDPGVGVYLDGVYLARTIGANLDLPDVERIEILKGPQGTLFGRNTIGGAISVVTRNPGKDFAFRGDVTTGRYNRLDIRASADVPLTDQLGAIVSFSSKKRDGYLKRIPFPGSQNFAVDPASAFRQSRYITADTEGGQDEWNLRGKLRWDGGPFRVSLGGDYARTDQTAVPTTVLATTILPGPFGGLAQNNIPGTALDVVTGSSGFLFAGLYNFCIGATPAQIAARNAQNLCGPRGTPLNPQQILPGLGSVKVDGLTGNDRLPYDNRFVSPSRDRNYATGSNFSLLNSWGLNASIEGDINDAITLRSITGFRKIDFKAGSDLDGSPVQILEISLGQKQQQFSQELQLVGRALDSRLKYVLGVYYFDEKGSALDYVNFSGGLLQIAGPVSIRTKNGAAFGQIDWRLSDLIGITVGARYTKEKKRFIGGQADLNGFNYKLFNCTVYGPPCQGALGFPVAGEPLRYYVSATQRQTFDNFAPKIGVQLYPTDRTMVFGNFSRGYKTGGWTTRLSNPLPFAPSFGPEKAESWEIGTKNQFFGRRLQVNAAAFTTRYDGIQLNFQEGVSPTIRNAGTARIKGFELEVVAVPVPALTINTSLGYTDAKYTSVDAAAQVAPSILQRGVYAGAPLPRAPNWKFNVSPRYEIMMAGGGRIALVGDYTRTSSLWNDTEGTFLIRRPSIDQLNASVSYRAPSEHWELTVGGTNLTNERYIIQGQGQFAGGLVYGTYNRPVEWYARLGLKF